MSLKPEILLSSNAVQIFNIYTRGFGLYSTVVDMDGKIIIDPLGPDTYIGLFYDMFERPQNRGLYRRIMDSLLDKENTPEPRLFDMGSDMPGGKISAALLEADGEYIGTWLLCGCDERGIAALSRIVNFHRTSAEGISDLVLKYMAAESWKRKYEAARERIEFEGTAHEIFTDCVIQLTKTRTLDFDELFMKIGGLYNAEFVGRYTVDESGGTEPCEQWFSSSVVSEEEREDYAKMGALTEGFVHISREDFIKGGFIIDNENMTNRIRVMVLERKGKAVIICPILRENKLIGQISIVENDSERRWKPEEVQMARDLTRLIAFALEFGDEKASAMIMGKALLSGMDTLGGHIFIKDHISGRILYASDSLNEFVGCELEGKDSAMLLGGEPHMELTEPGHNEGDTRSWEKYIENYYRGVVEIMQIDIMWTNDSPANLIILKKKES